MRIAYHHKSQMSSQRGQALIFALALVLIVAFIVFGATAVATQDYALLSTQRNASVAMSTAEAAVNWELAKMARYHVDRSGGVDVYGSPFIGSLPSGLGGTGPYVRGAEPIPGTVNVYVEGDGPGKPWDPVWRFSVKATASVDGTTRAVSVTGEPIGLTHTYTLYGINRVNFNGGGLAVRSRDGTADYIGSAGSIRWLRGADLRGTVVLEKQNGRPATWSPPPSPAPDFLWSNRDHMFPTVSQVAARTITSLGGSPGTNPLEYFERNNDNARFIKARDAAGQLHDMVWPVGSDERRINESVFAANISPGGDKRTIVLLGNPSLFNGWPRGSNFYLDELIVPNNRKLEIQIANEGGIEQGPVRLWLGPAGRSSTQRFEFLDGELQVDAKTRLPRGEAEPQRFAIYNGTGAPLRLGRINAFDSEGNIGYYGVIYSYNADGSGGYGQVAVEKKFTLRGGIVAWDIDHTAGLLDAWMPRYRGAPDPLLYVMYYATTSEWTEPNRYSASVFKF